MKIDYICSDGIHRAEKDAMEQMRTAFNESEFSQPWQGYAGFMMIDTKYRDREIDLVLLTHDRLLMVELKNWRGKIESMQDHWLLNGNDMGRSPVHVMADKWKILSSKIRERLTGPAKSVWIDYRVVLCGSADASNIPVDEKAYVITLEEFLKIAKPNGYKRVFGEVKGGKPCQHIQVFTNFFRGRDFKPSGFSFNNFQIVGEATFPHPDGLYKEYRSVKKDDRRHEALLRRWDFSALAGHADTVDERAQIALREHQVLGFIHEQNEELDSVVLQPLSHPTRDDVNADFCELYKLPSRQSRLSDFVNRYGADISPRDRLALVKVLISHFADLHDAGVAHRDIGDHSVWLERPSKVSLSSFVAAYFPVASTVGGLRDSIRAGKAVLPEDSDIGHGSTSNPFRRDVYLLGVVAHTLLYLRPPAKQEGLYVWKEIENDPYGDNLGTWISKSLELVPSDRFSNAREMLNELNTISHSTDSKPGLDMRSFETFRTDSIPMVVYPIIENIKQGHSHLYRSMIPYTNDGESLDYDADSVVEALQEINGELVRIGEMNTKESTPAILVLENPRFRMQQGVGDKIKLRSIQDLISFQRRRLAVTRILNRESVVPSLIDYFDPRICPAPTVLEVAPTDVELDAYNNYGNDRELEFSLNQQQRESSRDYCAKR